MNDVYIKWVRLRDEDKVVQSRQSYPTPWF